MTKAGSISIVLYWYQGLSGWAELGLDIPKVPVNTEMHLAVGWINTGDEDLTGHLALTVTKPDGSKVALADVLNQDSSASPGNGKTVQFEPVVLDQTGTYNGTAVLTETGGTTVLDEATFSFALVSGAGLDISALMGVMMVVMMMGMIMPMMEEG
jgi:hypothetical protein